MQPMDLLNSRKFGGNHMIKLIVSAGYALLFTMLFFTLLMPAYALAQDQPAATAMPAPTTLGTVTEKTSPSIVFLLAGAGIIGIGGVMIFMRYKR